MNMRTTEDLDDCTDNNECLPDNIKTLTWNPDEYTNANIELMRSKMRILKL